MSERASERHSSLSLPHTLPTVGPSTTPPSTTPSSISPSCVWPQPFLQQLFWYDFLSHLPTCSTRPPPRLPSSASSLLPSLPPSLPPATTLPHAFLYSFGPAPSMSLLPPSFIPFLLLPSLLLCLAGDISLQHAQTLSQHTVGILLFIPKPFFFILLYFLIFLHFFFLLFVRHHHQQHKRKLSSICVHEGLAASSRSSLSSPAAAPTLPTPSPLLCVHAYLFCPPSSSTTTSNI